MNVMIHIKKELEIKRRIYIRISVLFCADSIDLTKEEGVSGMLLQLEHMQIPVSDLEQAIAWYTMHLGFKLEGKHEHVHAFLTLPEGPMLMLWETKDNTAAHFTVNGKDMPVLLYRTEQIHELHNLLAGLGSTITYYRDDGFGWVLKFYDPFGNLWGAIQLNESR